MKTMEKRHRGWMPRAAAAVCAALLVAPSVAAACPLCKDALAGDPVGAALSWTTLVLIAAPMLLLGSIGGWVFHAFRRATHDKLAAEAPMTRAGWHMWKEKENET
jgi:hypothetical protein